MCHISDAKVNAAACWSQLLFSLPRLLAVVAAGLVPAAAAGEPLHAGQALCYQIEKTVNALVEFTQTSCIPARGKVKGGVSFILVSSKPVLSLDAARKGWIVVAVAAVGQALNRSPSVKGEEIWLSDYELTKKRTAYALPASLAKTLQREIKADKINQDEMYSAISQNLREKVVSH
jgi:hypothetical protein